MTETETQVANRMARERPFAIASIVVVLIGFYWRLAYSQNISPHIDEFITMLAGQMILEMGLPVLPSGLFYDTGILFSYTVAALTGAAGGDFNELIAKFPGLFFSLLNITLTYRIGKQFFSPAVGLMAAALLAFAPEAIIWGGRSRPYAAYQFWVLVGVWAMSHRISRQWRGRWQTIFWAAMAAAALSHLGGLIFMLAILMAAVPAWYLRVKQDDRHPAGWRSLFSLLWMDAILAFLLIGGMYILVTLGQPMWGQLVTGPLSPKQGQSPSVFLDVVYLIGPLLLLNPYYLTWAFMLLVNLSSLILKAIRQRIPNAQITPVFLHGVWLLSTVGLTLGSPWHIARYASPLMPIFFLLGSLEMSVVIQKIKTAIPKRQLSITGAKLAWGIVILISLIMTTPAYQTINQQEDGYDLAFKYVQEHWQEEDATMSLITSGSYLYLGKCDYYPTQKSFKGLGVIALDTPDGVIDRYVGAEWLATIAQIDEALSRAPRTWYILDDLRFDTRLLPNHQEAILERFEPMFNERNVTVYLHQEE